MAWRGVVEDEGREGGGLQSRSPCTRRPHSGSGPRAPRRIQVPVALWYGLQDPTVRMHTAHGLRQRLAHSTEHFLDGSHGLFFGHTEAIIDDLIGKMQRESGRGGGWGGE